MHIEMDGYRAKKLISMYLKLAQRVDRAEYLEDLIEKSATLDPGIHTNKLLRYLGFIQGALWMAGDLSLNEIKRQNNNPLVNPGEVPG